MFFSVQLLPMRVNETTEAVLTTVLETELIITVHVTSVLN